MRVFSTAEEKVRGRFRKMAIAGVTVSALAGWLFFPAGAAADPDASCMLPTGSTLTPNNGNLEVAQTFTALHTGNLATAQATLTNVSGSTLPWLLQIAATDGSGLPGSALASVSVPNTLAASAEGIVSGTFGSPAHVTAGTLYALIISRPGAGIYGVSDGGGDPCPGQAYYQNTVGGPFVVYPFVDFAFATTVEPPSATGQRAAALKKCKMKHSHKQRKKCRKKAKKLPV
jgi:hypothetical protein